MPEVAGSVTFEEAQAEVKPMIDELFGGSTQVEGVTSEDKLVRVLVGTKRKRMSVMTMEEHSTACSAKA